jgi:chromate transporter
MAPSTIETSVQHRAIPSLATLFLAFSGIAVMGFGGVMPFARRMLVEQRRWMSPDEFNEAYSLAQFLPGGNIINLSVVVGRRFQGAPGALICVAGLVSGPTFIMIGFGIVYARYGDVPAVQNALAGVAAAAAGLILSMAAKMAVPMVRKGALLPASIAVLAFVAVALAQVSLLVVVAVLAPISVSLAWRRWL